MSKLKINHTNTYSSVCFCPDSRLMTLRTDWLSPDFLELQWIRKAPSLDKVLRYLKSAAWFISQLILNVFSQL